ncbi:MAG: hypothetical protein ABII22_07155 [Candidatus Micrarchaeota archaeon]
MAKSLTLQRTKDFTVEKYGIARQFAKETYGITKKIAGEVLLETKHLFIYGFLGSNLSSSLKSAYKSKDNERITQILESISERGKGNYGVAKLLANLFMGAETSPKTQIIEQLKTDMRLKLLEMYPHLSQRKQHKIFICVARDLAKSQDKADVQSLVGQLILKSSANRRVANELIRMAVVGAFPQQVQEHFETIYASLSQKDRANVFKNLVNHVDIFTRMSIVVEESAVSLLGLIESIGRKSQTTYKDDEGALFDKSIYRLTEILDSISQNDFHHYDSFQFLRLACARVMWTFNNELEFLVEKFDDDATAGFAVATLSRVDGGLDCLFKLMEEKGTTRFTPALSMPFDKIDRIPMVVSLLPLQIAEPILADWMNRGELGTIHALRSLAAREQKTDTAIQFASGALKVGIIVPNQLVAKIPACMQSDNDAIRLAAIGVGLRYSETSKQAFDVLASDPSQYAPYVQVLPLALAEVVLLDWFRRNSSIRWQAIEDLRQRTEITPLLSIALVQSLSSENENLRLNAILRCTQFGIANAVPHLSALLETKLPVENKEAIYVGSLMRFVCAGVDEAIKQATKAVADAGRVTGKGNAVALGNAKDLLNLFVAYGFEGAESALARIQAFESISLIPRIKSLEYVALHGRTSQVREAMAELVAYADQGMTPAKSALARIDRAMRFERHPATRKKAVAEAYCE